MRSVRLGFSTPRAVHGASREANWSLALLVRDALYPRGRRGIAHPSCRCSNGVVNAIVPGWSANTIATFMTGNWLRVTVAGDRANVGGFPFQRANTTCDGNLLRDKRTIDRYFNTSCFSERFA
jgi:hypothetical protein